jgi:Mrp family chromosome partitioning ATPase
MGRMLEILKRGHAPPPQTEPEPLVESDAVPSRVIDPAELTDSADIVPFIEVGAPGKRIDGSPAVLAIHPPQQPPVQPPHHVERPKLAAASAPLIASLREPPPLAVSFQACSPAPQGRPAAELIVFHKPDHPASRQYGVLFGQLTAGLVAHESPVLLMTGLSPRIGATTILLNVASWGGAQAKRRIIVVDANLERPAVSQRLGLMAPAGLKEVLAGSVALEQAVQPTAVPLLHVLSTTATTDRSLFTPEAVRWLLGCLRQRFELLLVDGPDLNASKTLAVLAPNCDGVYLVLPRDEAASTSAAPYSQQVTRLGGRLRGLIHTQFGD